MGNFILGLIICSSVYQTCLPPYEWPNKFNSHYECMIFGYEESIRKAEEIGPKDINLVLLLNFIVMKKKKLKLNL